MQNFKGKFLQDIDYFQDLARDSAGKYSQYDIRTRDLGFNISNGRVARCSEFLEVVQSEWYVWLRRRRRSSSIQLQCYWPWAWARAGAKTFPLFLRLQRLQHLVQLLDEFYHSPYYGCLISLNIQKENKKCDGNRLDRFLNMFVSSMEETNQQICI